MARIATVLLALLGFSAWATPLFAELSLFHGVVMPGEVIKGHEKYEKECKYCHVPFKKSEQTRLCLDCHDHANVARDIAARRGYHGRIADKTCNKCHTDHKGRNMDIVQLNKKTFDHDATDFPLRGKHLRDKHRKVVKCKSCHKNKNKRHRGTPKKCYACHRRDDPHKGEQGRRCEKCHSAYGWHKARARVDHDLARFPLLGKHADVKCKKCHKKRTFRDAPTECWECHKKDDEHKGRLSKSCDLCHQPRGWEYWRFDHNRQTDFPLQGRHKGLKCHACHKTKIRKQISLSSNCQSCHRDDDVHDGAFGSFCQRCHVPKSFRHIKLMGKLRR